MKKYTAIALVAAFALLGGISIRSQGVQERRNKHEAVVLWAYQAGQQIDTGYQYAGANIYVSSSSAGAPAFPQAIVGGPYTNLTKLADGLAELLDSGFQIKQIGDNGTMFVLTKP